MKNTNKGLIVLLFLTIAALLVIGVTDLVTLIKYGGGNAFTDTLVSFTLVAICVAEIIIQVKKGKQK